MSARNQLIKTTRDLLSTQGYEATSPGQIQIESGVGQGSFYHHFGSKADLAAHALGSLSQDMREEFYAASPSEIDGYLNADRDPLAGCRIGRITMEASISDERIREPIGDYFTHLRQRLTVAFEELELGDEIPAHALADLAIAAVQGGLVVSRATADPTAQANAIAAISALNNHCRGASQ